MKKIKVLIISLTVIMLFLELVNIYFLNKITTDSIYASKTQEKIKEYEDKNTALQTEILEYTSYEMISSRAAELGFVEPKEFISLQSPLQVAIKK